MRDDLRDMLEYQVRMNEVKKQMDYSNQLGGVGFKDMKLHKS